MWRRLLLLSGVLGVAGWLAGTVSGQETAGPPSTQPTTSEASIANQAAPASGRGAGPMSIEELSVELGFEGSYDERTVRTKSSFWPVPATRQMNQSRRLEETLGLQSSGNIGGEEVVLYDVGATLGLSQEKYSELGLWPDRRDRSNGDLLQYDVNLTALPRGKITANVFAQKLDSRVPRMFLPSLDRSLERYGGDLLLNDATFPMRLSFEHVDEELTSRTRDLNDDEKRGRDSFRYEGTWQPSRNQSLRLEYEYSDRQEQYSGSNTRFDTRRNYLALNHVWRFGEDDRSSLETLVRWQDETGDLGRDTAEFSSRLRLQHTDKLATNYAFEYLRDGFHCLETDTARGEAGISYQFDPSLLGSVQGYGSEQRADESADACERGTIGNLSYAKDNSLGRSSANLSYYHTETESRSGARRGIVIAESVALHDPLSAFLAHADVDIFSIVVTDSTRTRTLLPGRDYVAVPVGRYTALQRLPFGAIADGDTVLASYTYDVRDDYQVRRDRADLRIQHDFKFGLSPYYAGSLQDEDIDRDRFLPFRERDVNRHRLGATYRRPRWSAGLEYEYNDDSLDPFQAVHGNGDVVLFRNAWHELDGKATVSRFWFDGTDDLASHDTTLADLGMTYRYVLAPRLEANSSAMYRYEDDSLFGVTHGVDLTAAVDWRIGYFTLRFETEYDLLHLPGSDDDGFSFWVKLKREISVITKGRPE
jgi:hypothetical protein